MRRLFAKVRLDPHLLPFQEKPKSVTLTQSKTGRYVYREASSDWVQFRTFSFTYALGNAGLLTTLLRILDFKGRILTRGKKGI